MKYSIILPYFKRPSLKSTLLSFDHHYNGRNDYEVIVVEDIKNNEDQPSHNQLLSILNEFKDKIKIKHLIDPVRSFNPAKKFNAGYKASTGEFIVLSNPETAHSVNVLAGFDSEFSTSKTKYIVCSCQSISYAKPVFDRYEDINLGTMVMWYQHSQARNKRYHFCTAISRNMYARVGGFDERYSDGIAYDDDSFVRRVEANGIPFHIRDDLITIHINHEDNTGGKGALVEKNRALYYSQVVNKDYFEPNEIRSMYIPECTISTVVFKKPTPTHPPL